MGRVWYLSLISMYYRSGRQFKTSLERYRDLMNHTPDLLQRVQLGYIASYLGITQVSLSRIRAKFR